MAARPLKRAIQQSIENPLAKQILEGKFSGRTRSASNTAAARCSSKGPPRDPRKKLRAL